MSPAATVLIADDHELSREGLRSVIEREEGLSLVGEASDAAGAVDLAARMRPDLVVLDIRFSGASMDGLDAARGVRQVSPDSGILMLTLYDDPEYIAAAIRAGASGYILKDARREDLVGAMRAVASGRSVLPRDLVARALASGSSEGAALGAADLSRLTLRESHVLELVAEGLTNKQIAQKLGISPGTAKVHVERLISKLGVLDRTQAAVLFARASKGGASHGST